MPILIGIPKNAPGGHKQAMYEGALRVAEELGADTVEGRSEDLLMDLKRRRLDGVICGSDKLGIIATPDFQDGWRASPLSFGYCRLALLGRADAKPMRLVVSNKETLTQVLPDNPLRVVTSYPELFTAWVEKNPLPYELEQRSGGCEAVVARGWADAAFDIIDTGSTMRRHGLVPWVDNCLTLQAMLVNLLPK
ncbi:MAG: hypothetical protein GC129_00565 [Proteobacteria bacterium]|nr:hypothetical protein [Pseudomonadota bacterium]